MEKQEELRKKVRFLKWNNNIDYGEIADAIGMSRFSFYNFIGGKKVDAPFSIASQSVPQLAFLNKIKP